MPIEGKSRIFELQRGYETKSNHKILFFLFKRAFFEEVADQKIAGPFTSSGARARGVKSEIFTDVPLPVQFQVFVCKIKRSLN